MKPEAGCNDPRAPQSPDSADAFRYGIDMAKPGSERHVLRATGPGVDLMMEFARGLEAEGLEAMLEQARSTTRRNILKAVDHLNGKLPEKWDVPEQDIAVAMVALRQSIKAEHAGDHKASVMERFAFDQMRKAENELKNREITLRGAIKGRDGKIKDLQAQVDQLSRYIAFQVAK